MHQHSTAVIKHSLIYTCYFEKKLFTKLINLVILNILYC